MSNEHSSNACGHNACLSCWMAMGVHVVNVEPLPRCPICRAGIHSLVRIYKDFGKDPGALWLQEMEVSRLKGKAQGVHEICKEFDQQVFIPILNDSLISQGVRTPVAMFAVTLMKELSDIESQLRFLSSMDDS